MKNLNKLFLLTFAATLIFFSCSDFVADTDAPIDIITDESLTTEAQVPFLETGVLARFVQAVDNLSVLAGGLSDELQFDSDGNSLATFPTFREIDQGDITFDNNSVDGPYATINEARFIADDLIRRIDEIGTFDDAAVKDQALYTANLVGGMTRFWLGTYFGLTPGTPGAPIDNSDIISREDLNTQAIAKLDAALTFANNATQTKVVNSLKVEIYMSVNDYASAATVLQGSVLENGDAPYQALYNQQSQNIWYTQAGEGRTQLNVDQRFADYINAEATEANRINIVSFVETVLTPSITYYYHGYDRTDPINITTWQEMDLARAEILLDDPAANVGAAGATPLSLINDVRASHNIPAFAGVVDQDIILEERDKELFATGNRLLDQLRTNNFHLTGGGNYTLPSTGQTGNTVILIADPWQHFPITSRERNNNPNFD